MDGVLRIGNNIIDGSHNIIPLLKNKFDINSIILTNECRYTNRYLKNNLEELGIKLENDTIIYTSANSIQYFFEQNIMNKHNKINIIYIGENGLKQAIYNLNLNNNDNIRIYSSYDRIDKEYKYIKNNKFYMVIGTINNISIEILENILYWLKFKPKIFTTCKDMNDPSSKGNFHLGLPNQILHILKYNAKTIHYSLGKPNPIITRNILEKAKYEFNIPNIKNEEIIVIGDTLYTDIRLAVEAGFKSILVLSGNTKSSGLKNYVLEPDYVMDSVNTLYKYLNKN